MMRTRPTRLALLLALGWATFQVPTASAAPPAPCQVLPAEAWSSIMGYTATATPGDMNCTYEGPAKTGGGQFRILAVVGTSAEAEASAKRMQERQSKNPHASLAVVDSQGTTVFSIALFQKAPTDSTASQLQKLVAAAKQHLPK